MMGGGGGKGRVVHEGEDALRVSIALQRSQFVPEKTASRWLQGSTATQRCSKHACQLPPPPLPPRALTVELPRARPRQHRAL